ncbi:DUF1307 domain-containing protein [Streptococcus pacificus]|uniref:DUF1307 domain-containing protein n=1 Tax=Streptococcus pacificus TaxID=2740577 RepID=A0ABS0ZHD9_9STRE|nr:DUF1307 domain-containing protein [Streptococcus pacificus]MBJ8325409.1 DUF1307 domain-containing protein [Streptococcus pacificus]
MKRNKTLISFLLVIVMIILNACGSKEKTIESIAFQNAIPGRDIRYIFYYEKGSDKIVKQESITIFSYSAFGVDSQEEAKALLDPLSKDYEAIKGVTQTVEYETDYLTEKIMVDYSKVDLKQLKDDPRFEIEGEDADYFSLTRSVKPFRNKTSGFVEIKDGNFKEFQP